jgi:hypothetical protein
MAKVTSRSELKEYCLRKLGSPVLEINVADEQVEDRIDDAFQFYREYHFDAVESVLLKHKFTEQDLQNRYIEVNDLVVGVNRILPFTNRSRGVDIFDIRYQILINDLYSLMSTDLIYYSMVKTQIELINHLLVGQQPIRFNRHMNRIYLDMDWTLDSRVGEFIIIDAYRILDPNEYSKVYDDMYLKRYATSLIKRQWGENLKKFEGVQLPGGVTLSGQKLYDEAMQEIADIEQEIRSTFELPVDMFVG